jgi:SAM-dependent methyltransferase
MRYYCEFNPQTINHVTPSVLMLDYKIQHNTETDKYAKAILDLGCGNGRNSLYLAKKYGSTNVVLVDSDIGMLNWAQHLFSLQGIPIESICTKVEELAGDPSELYSKTGISSFDIVILSYVVQHIDPVYYPLIFDFCKQISKGYMAIDVFWNPTRLGAGEFTKIGSVNWYGLTYEELITLVASRFHVLKDMIHRTNISFMVNMLVTEGQTSLENVLRPSYDCYSYGIRRRRSYGIRGLPTKNRMKNLVNINELECVKCLSSLYPAEIDIVKMEFSQWMETYGSRITPSLMAAKFLWLCRTSRLPVMLNEVARDFGVRTKNILYVLSETDYIPPLSTSDYIHRLSKQLSLPDNIRDHALDVVKEDAIIDNTTPIMRACCAVIKAIEAQGFRLHRWQVTSVLGLTTVGVRMALNRLEEGCGCKKL